VKHAFFSNKKKPTKQQILENLVVQKPSNVIRSFSGPDVGVLLLFRDGIVVFCSAPDKKELTELWAEAEMLEGLLQVYKMDFLQAFHCNHHLKFLEQQYKLLNPEDETTV